MSDKQGNILIVDDTSKNIQVLATILSENGYQIRATTNGAEALKSVRNSLPDLILLDIMMPEMDGFATCEALKADEASRDIPVIFLTAKNETEDVAKGFKLGAVDYITKPFNPTELLARVKNHLELKKSRETISQVSSERKELLHVLCHDLANPIGFVMGVIDLASDDPSFYIEMKENIKDSMKNSLDMIGLIRSMMALEEKRLNFTTEEYNLKRLVTESLQILKLRINEKEIAINESIPEDITVYVEKISFVNSVMNNALTNAIKFSDRGGKITINATAEKEEVILTIKDSGIGMPESIRKDLFDIKKKTSRAGTNGESGTGFGMPLMKKFIEAYGGSIEVLSHEKKDSPEHGTEVKIALPLKGRSE